MFIKGNPITRKDRLFAFSIKEVKCNELTTESQVMDFEV